ncbi:hypothetical protein EZV62_024828 [Acer yangbiense]|uniref:Uncharacterized protein n=1 Tax=Acer yangbiense TaxID=1000413 RepID=A0A5C7GW49_9ROSI|nr:hypothetical protein EZV62_024828 [Acer yangbiense]
MQSYALNEDFEIPITRSSTTRYEAGCKDPKCKFQIRAVKMEGGNYWIVRIFEEDHSCTIDALHNRYRQASAWLIGEMLSPKLAVSGRSLKPKEIMTDMRVEHGLALNYTKAWKAKEHAENNVFGPPDMSYQLLPAYCHELKCVNPGSVKRNLWTSVLISTKQTLGWKAILVSSFPLNTPANGILLLKYVPKLFFHRSGELKPVGRDDKGSISRRTW